MKLWNNIKKTFKEFFEDDKENETEEEISLKTLLIVFIIGIFIISILFIYSSLSNEERNDFNSQFDPGIIEELKEETVNNYFNIDGCFFQIDLKNMKDSTFPPMKIKNGLVGFSGMIEIPLNVNNKLNIDNDIEAVNLMILEYGSEMSDTVSFAVGDGNNYSKEVSFNVKNELNWSKTYINTTGLFKADYYFLGLSTNEANILYLNKIILCK